MSSGSSGVVNARRRHVARAWRRRRDARSRAAVGRGRVAAGPGDERVHALDRDRDLLASMPSTSGVSGKNQRRRSHPSPSTSASVTAPSAAAAGSVSSQAKPIARHDRPAHVVPAPAPGPDADHRGRDDLRRRHRRPRVASGEDHSRRRGLAGEAVDRPRGGRCARPTCGRSASRPARCRAVSVAPHASLTQSGTVNVSIAAGGEQQRHDHPHRLLCVVRAVAEGERGRHRPLARPDRRRDAPRGARSRRRRAGAATPTRARTRSPARHRQRDQDAEHADRLPAVEPAPVDRVDARLCESGADQAADQRVRPSSTASRATRSARSRRRRRARRRRSRRPPPRAGRSRSRRSCRRRRCRPAARRAC